MKIIKKILQKGLVALMIATALFASQAFVQAQDLFPKITPTGETPSKLVLVQQLPNETWQVLIGNVIKLVLAACGSLAVASFTVGGVMMVTAQGVEDKIRKSKAILLWSVLALVIIAASYGIVLGITQLQFFQ